MISLTTAEINAWIAAFFFPLARVLALLAAPRHSTTRPCRHACG
jgi:flagellar biosynthesis protein FliR